MIGASSFGFLLPFYVKRDIERDETGKVDGRWIKVRRFWERRRLSDGKIFQETRSGIRFGRPNRFSSIIQTTKLLMYVSFGRIKTSFASE